MACIPAHARVAGWYSGGGKWARLPGWLSPGESQQWAVNKLLWPGWPAAFPSLETCLTVPHRPGSRWPLAAGLARSSVHYRAAMEKLTITKIALSYPCYAQFVNCALTGRNGHGGAKMVEKRWTKNKKKRKNIMSHESAFCMEDKEYW